MDTWIELEKTKDTPSKEGPLSSQESTQQGSVEEDFFFQDANSPKVIWENQAQEDEIQEQLEPRNHDK